MKTAEAWYLLPSRSQAGGCEGSSTRIWRELHLPTNEALRNGGWHCQESGIRVEGERGLVQAPCAGIVRSAPAQDGGPEQFITEHYWGYSARRNRSSLEYHVSHPPWNVWTADVAGFEGDATSLYGVELGGILLRRPDSAFIADGSPVKVFKGREIKSRT